MLHFGHYPRVMNQKRDKGTKEMTSHAHWLLSVSDWFPIDHQWWLSVAQCRQLTAYLYKWCLISTIITERCTCGKSPLSYGLSVYYFPEMFITSRQRSDFYRFSIALYRARRIFRGLTRSRYTEIKIFYPTSFASFHRATYVLVHSGWPNLQGSTD